MTLVYLIKFSNQLLVENNGWHPLLLTGWGKASVTGEVWEQHYNNNNYYYSQQFLCFQIKIALENHSSSVKEPVKFIDRVKQRNKRTKRQLNNNQTQAQASKRRKKYYKFLHPSKVRVIMLGNRTHLTQKLLLAIKMINPGKMQSDIFLSLCCNQLIS